MEPAITFSFPGSAAERAKQLRAAESIVRQHAGLGLGCGLIPLPLVDQAALTLVLLSMLSRCHQARGRTAIQV